MQEILINVELGPLAYPIVIGSQLLKEAGAHIKAHIGTPTKLFIVTDEHLAKLHLNRLSGSLAGAGFALETKILPPGEETKSFEQLAELTRWMVRQGIDRHSIIIAFGGGVIGDLAGFAAAIVLRGVPFVQIPTSLLAQVDSSVGGKTAIDVPEGKNLIGAFYQPELVLMDLDLLKTLPLRQIKAGYAEILKYGLIDDPDFFDWLQSHGTAIMAGDEEALAYAIERSCQNKARIVAADEKEGGVRALLNLGHTFAHALEVEAGLGDRLLHGEAVSIGLHLAFRLSVKLGLCQKEDLERLLAHLRALEMPIWPQQMGLAIDPQRLLAHMQKDKKTRAGKLHLVLARGIGQSFFGAKVDDAELEDFWAEIGAAAL